MLSRLVFFEQSNPRGYGDAILRAREFAGNESFLHLVSDHLYLSRTDRLCAQQLVEAATRHECSVSAIQPTRENEVAFFGTVGGTPLAQSDNLYEVSTVIEKPTPTIAEQRLIVAGQRAGYYLCMFGMHVLTPTVLTLLQKSLDAAPAGQKYRPQQFIESARADRTLSCPRNRRFPLQHQLQVRPAAGSIGVFTERR